MPKELATMPKELATMQWNSSKVINCLCPDGKRRVARLGQADTWFSISALVKAFGKTVTGFVTAKETETGERDYEFIPYLYRKNHAIFTKEQ